MAYYTQCIPRGEQQLNGSTPVLHDFGSEVNGYVGNCLMCGAGLEMFEWNGENITRMALEDLTTAIDWVYKKDNGNLMRWLPVLQAAEAFADNEPLRKSIWGPSPMKVLSQGRGVSKSYTPRDVKVSFGGIEVVGTAVLREEVQKYLDDIQTRVNREGQGAEEVEVPRAIETIDFGST